LTQLNEQHSLFWKQKPIGGVQVHWKLSQVAVQQSAFIPQPAPCGKQPGRG
jgi:hypothetical protein